MTQSQQDLLRQAARSTAAAKANLELGYPEVAASRAYYAALYIAEAFRDGDGLRFSSHAAVMGAFGKHFAKTGRVPPEYHRFLITLQKLRMDADYRTYVVAPAEAAEQVTRVAACRHGRRLSGRYFPRDWSHASMGFAGCVGV